MRFPDRRRSIDLRKYAKPLIGVALLITLVMGALLGRMASWSLAILMVSPVLLILASVASWIRPNANLHESASRPSSALDTCPRVPLAGSELGSAPQQAAPVEYGLPSMDMMDDRMLVRHPPGSGSSFHIQMRLSGLRATTSDRRSADEDLSSASGKLHTSREAHILVAEDDPITQNVARLMLKKFGCRVDLVSDGEEAISKAADTSYDLILMDCTMPQLDGYRATGRIRASEGELRRTPIIALTANALPQNRALCLAAGMDDVLIKPVLVEQMRIMLLRWLPTHLIQSA